MKIDVITQPEELDDLRGNWEALYEQDPDANYFLSWAFLSSYLRRFEGAWFILAARRGPKGSPYVALLPLRLRTRMKSKTGDFYNEINMGGNHAADYTGVICAPGFAERAIAAFAKHLKTMHWASLHLENLRMSERRERWFLEYLSDKRLSARRMRRVNQLDKVDNCVCPEIHLPHTWEEYLQNNLSGNTRQKMRRFLRKVESSGEFRITHADASTIKRDIEILLEFWRIKWTPRKGNLIPGLVKSNRLIFSQAFESGTLFLPVLWHGDRPLSALAIFVDPVKKSMLFHMVGRDETADVIPTGLVLHGHCIRLAIEQGFRTYDFLRGNEPYKYSFGVRERKLNCTLIRTRTGRNLGDKLDMRSLNAVFREGARFHKKGEFVKAENVYRQILNTDPRHGQALFGSGHLAAARGDHREAVRCFEQTLAAVAPQPVKAVLSLAVAWQSLNEHAAAAAAFAKAVALDPGSALAQYGLGRNLLALEKRNEAAEAFAAVLRNKSPAPEDVALRAKAQRQLNNLQETRPRYIMVQVPEKTSGLTVRPMVPQAATAVALYLPLPGG
jgi:CelD/BcsL family acetyltransferase involved in cellulose biosynthesis/TolA-binding protein